MKKLLMPFLVLVMLLLVVGLTYATYSPSIIAGIMGINAKQPVPTPTPSEIYDPPTVWITPTPTIIPEPLQTTTEPLVDCIGPDKKHLHITQKQCDDFNKAWGKSGSTQSSNSQTQLILDNAKNNAKYFDSQACILSAKLEVESCNKSCGGSYEYGRSACSYALDNLGWDTSRYSECLNENSAEWDSCTNQCTANMQTKLNSC